MKRKYRAWPQGMSSTENRKLSPPRCWNGPGLPVITSVPVYFRPQSHDRNISSTLATLPACVSSGAKVGPRHALHPGTDSRAEMSWTDILVEQVGHLVDEEGPIRPDSAP
jgi:hypothetical protein